MFRTTPLIVAAASAALAGAGLLAQPRPAGANGDNGGITMSSRHATQDPQAAGPAARATASARASASASSSSGGARGECRARSESSAQARSGDQVVSDHDRDEQVARDGACNARAESRAQARTGPPD